MTHRILFYAYTPFQIIVSLAIHRQFFSAMDADIILSEEIQNRHLLKTNIIKRELFADVYYEEIRKFFPKGKNRKVREWNRFKTGFDPYYIASTIGLKHRYNVFITTEINYYTESIYSLLRKYNPHVRVQLMDEGYSSYSYYFREAYKPTTLKNKIKKSFFYIQGSIIGRKFIAESAKVLYLFEPELLNWKGNPYEVKKIDVDKVYQFCNLVNQLFGIDTNHIKKFKEDFDRKFIFFEESFFWDLSNTNDEKIIEHIRDIVGNNNMVIKLHPRNEINRFSKRGFKTVECSELPWEVIALNLSDEEEKVFISFSSGAVLNYKFLSNKNFSTVLLYKCYENQFYNMEESTKEWFKLFEERYGERMSIPDTVNQLDEVLLMKI